MARAFAGRAGCGRVNSALRRGVCQPGVSHAAEANRIERRPKAGPRGGSVKAEEGFGDVPQVRARATGTAGGLLDRLQEVPRPFSSRRGPAPSRHAAAEAGHRAKRGVGFKTEEGFGHVSQVRARAARGAGRLLHRLQEMPRAFSSRRGPAPSRHAAAEAGHRAKAHSLFPMRDGIGRAGGGQFHDVQAV